MLRTFLRQSLVALAAVALFLPIAAYYGPPAEALSITINGDTCSSPSASADAQGNITITCGGGGGAPVCSISGAGSGVIGTPITLTANCSNSPNSWTWGNNGDGAGSTCVATNNTATCSATGPAANGNVQYTLTASNGTGSDQQRTKTVSWSNTVAAPSQCTLSPPSNAQASGYSATFTVTCNAGGAPTGWVWSGPGTAGCNTASCGPITFTSTGTINVTPSNGGGNGNLASSTITIGGGGGGPISCTNVPGGTKVINVDALAKPSPLVAGAGLQATTQSVGGLGANDALVVKFTASPSLTSETAAGTLLAAEYGDLAAARFGALSASPCDFTGGIAYTCTDRRGRTSTLYSVISAGPINPQSSYGVVSANCQPMLTPGQVYYWNLTTINPATGAQNCSGQTCNMIITINAPNGT